MTPTDGLVAALAEMLIDIHKRYAVGPGYDEAYDTFADTAMTRAAVGVAALTPEARDKMLLGFAVAELPDEAHLFIAAKGSVVWGSHGDIPVKTGPTPLAAVEAALQELRDD